MKTIVFIILTGLSFGAVAQSFRTGGYQGGAQGNQISCPADIPAAQSPFLLTGAFPQWGDYDGPGVSQGVFHPATAGPGTHTVTYTFAYSSTYSEQCQFTVTVPEPPVYTVSFVVQDIHGTPVQDAVITLESTVNDPGQYSFPGLAAGTYAYHVAATGYHDETGDVEVTDADVQVTVQMKGDDVPLTRLLQNVHVGDGVTGCFDAWNSLVTGGEGGPFVVSPGGAAELISAGNIRMLYGTHIQKGGYLHAYITHSGAFCGQTAESLLAAGERPTDGAPDMLRTREIPLNMDETGEQAPLFTVYPNPTSDRFVLAVLCPVEEQEIWVRIVNMRGEVIKDRIIKGSVEEVFSLAGHAPGVYLIVATTNERLAHARILKR